MFTILIHTFSFHRSPIVARTGRTSRVILLFKTIYCTNKLCSVIEKLYDKKYMYKYINIFLSYFTNVLPAPKSTELSITQKQTVSNHLQWSCRCSVFTKSGGKDGLCKPAFGSHMVTDDRRWWSAMSAMRSKVCAYCFLIVLRTGTN